MSTTMSAVFYEVNIATALPLDILPLGYYTGDVVNVGMYIYVCVDCSKGKKLAQ